MKFKINKEPKQRNKEKEKINLKKKLSLNLIKNLNNLKNNLHSKEIQIPIDFLQLRRDLQKQENHKELTLINKKHKTSLRKLSLRRLMKEPNNRIRKFLWIYKIRS